MISKVSSNILNYLIRNEVINDTEEERNYYQYGIEITISSALNFFLVFLIGAVTRNILESIVFMIFFVPIRQITGGYHAKTYFRCNLYLCMVFVSILLLYRFTNEYITSYSAILISFICSSVFVAGCPVENPNKPIPAEKRVFYKIMAAVLGICYGIIAAVLTALSYKTGMLILLTLLAVAMLVIIAVIEKKGGSSDEEE
ncbi:MAG: accessory gene regulator B family protein [Oscillospiraceae bacterium]|nr:accessory gene regulator B family protein [Oscillospiraceae bacterium]MDO5151467.1 accessory gene regulator B family protein [Oscillospiraceae bacterium]